MLIAYNNDIEYKNRWYHIQTEDNGIKDGHITTTVFHSGAILDAKTTSYKEAIAGITDTDAQNDIIKDMMKKQHQVMYAKLTEGSYEDIVNGTAKRTSAPQHQVIRKATTSAPQPPIGHSNPQVQPVPAASSIGNLASRSDFDNAAASSKVMNKPNILRASQQMPGVAKNIGMKSLTTNLTQKPSGMQPIVNTSAISQIGHQSQQNAQVSRQAVAAPVRVPHMNIPITRSRAVIKAMAIQPHKSFTGFRWPNDDLAIDVLVATLLDNV